MLGGIELHNGDPRLHDATRLSDLGIEKTASHRYQTMSTLPEPELEEYFEYSQANDREITSADVYRKALQLEGKGQTTKPKNPTWDNLNAALIGGLYS